MKNVDKALDNLIKGGAGSRGGHVIGKTKSGKPIYANFSHADHAGFSKRDHKDAAALHEKVGSNTPDMGLGEAHNMQRLKHLDASGAKFDRDDFDHPKWREPQFHTSMKGAEKTLQKEYGK